MSKVNFCLVFFGSLLAPAIASAYTDHYACDAIGVSRAICVGQTVLLLGGRNCRVVVRDIYRRVSIETCYQQCESTDWRSRWGYRYGTAVSCQHGCTSQPVSEDLGFVVEAVRGSSCPSIPGPVTRDSLVAAIDGLDSYGGFTKGTLVRVATDASPDCVRSVAEMYDNGVAYLEEVGQKSCATRYLWSHTDEMHSLESGDSEYLPSDLKM